MWQLLQLKDENHIFARFSRDANNRIQDVLFRRSTGRAPTVGGLCTFFPVPDRYVRTTRTHFILLYFRGQQTAVFFFFLCIGGTESRSLRSQLITVCEHNLPSELEHLLSGGRRLQASLYGADQPHHPLKRRGGKKCGNTIESEQLLYANLYPETVTRSA
jgi:hypothetical protein